MTNNMTINSLTSEILNFASKNKSGFTLDLTTLKPITSGFVVSYKETQNSFNALEVQGVIEHALKNDKVIGGWFNEKNNKFYFDSNKVFSINELEEAIEFGKKNEQISIFNLDRGKPIWLDNQPLTEKFSFSSFSEWFLSTGNEIVNSYKGDLLIDSHKIVRLRNEHLFNSYNAEYQEFSLYWGLRECGTWLYHIGGDNAFSINELQLGLGAKKIYLITFRYDSAKNEFITVTEIDKDTI